MLRVLLKVLLAAAALAAVWAFVPVGGRTMSDRWSRARSPAEFVDRAWAEVRGAGRRSPGPRPARPPAPAARAQARTGPQAGRPAESHTEADRKALDRIVTEHLEP